MPIYKLLKVLPILKISNVCDGLYNVIIYIYNLLQEVRNSQIRHRKTSKPFILAQYPFAYLLTPLILLALDIPCHLPFSWHTAEAKYFFFPELSFVAMHLLYSILVFSQSGSSNNAAFSTSLSSLDFSALEIVPDL